MDEKKGADGDVGDSGVLLYSRTPALGRHILLDLSITDQSLLSDVEKLQAVFLDAAAAGNLTVIDKKFHKFSPHGVTGILVSLKICVCTWETNGRKIELSFIHFPFTSCRHINVC